ncbi:MAG: hypothetical protein EZS28_014179 [Streblomastix strix]|uniref:Uncharacterized protein n=1 Tax=Streblomastix strix TaxID=222440 RepID=A0A5J4W6L3_9EUKA|nr:MAG: hypothetical protein EZS28_014179 [Streblomastix strix]
MGQLTIEPNDDIRNQGIRIMKNKANWDSFVLTGCNVDPTDTDRVWKIGSTSSQFRIQKQEDQAYDYKGIIIDFECSTLKFNNQLVAPIPTPPIENAIKQTIAYDEAKPQFIGTPFKIPLNAVMFAQKVIGYPICWNGAIPMDCYIDVDGHVRINTMCQLVLPDDFCVQAIWEAAIKYACESKICR